MPDAWVASRGVVRVAGEAAAGFLQGLITADTVGLELNAAAYGALLTPQGKIVADFIVIRAHDAFYLDVKRALAGDLVRKLIFYRLRAKVEIEDLSDQLGVVAAWGDAASPVGMVTVRDPRHADLGTRTLVEGPAEGSSSEAAYHAHRIKLAIPEGGEDFAYGDAFPHEADMDQLAGVAFDKGCYVGQEVVSRMQHRGTARTRVVPVRFSGPAPAIGVDVVAGSKTVGTMGSAAGESGLALLRLDRVSDALAAGEPLLAGGIAIEAVRPAWARFAFPGDPA